MSLKKTLTTVCFALLLLSICHAKPTNKTFNIHNFGATGDGTTLDTSAIQKAIDTCSSQGGGIVQVPAGTYLVGCIELKDNVNLHLAAKATLLGSTQQKDYSIKNPVFKSRTNDLYVNKSVIYAEKVKNASLTGFGIIDGQGRAKSFSRTRPQNARPYLARFIECENLLIENVSMLESANWTCHLLGCNGVKVINLTIKNSVRANRDGLDIDSCQNVVVQNCTIDSQDDAIVLKSTSNVPCKNILIENCTVSSHASGIKMGTESNGGYEEVTIRNCKIHDVPALAGLGFMIVDGGTMRNIRVENIEMDRVNVPIFLRLGKRSRPITAGDPVPGVGTVENISYSNITVRKAGYPCTLTGLHEKNIKNIQLKNIDIEMVSNFNKTPLPYNKIPFMEQQYPQSRLYGSKLPTSAFYIRNISKLKMENISIRIKGDDRRIPIVIDRTDTALFSDLKLKSTKVPESMLYLRNASDILIQNINGKSDLIVTSEKGNCSKLNLAKIPASKQKIVPALLDQTYEKINAFSRHSFNGKTYRGLPCITADTRPTFTLKARKGSPCKILLLTAAPAGKSTIELLVNGQKQIAEVRSAEWGWSTLHLLNPVQSNTVTLQIINASNPAIYLAQAGLIPLKLTD